MLDDIRDPVFHFPLIHKPGLVLHNRFNNRCVLFILEEPFKQLLPARRDIDIMAFEKLDYEFLYIIHSLPFGLTAGSIFFNADVQRLGYNIKF